MAVTADWIAVDWGTSKLRAYAMRGEDVLGASPTPVDAQTHRAWLERDVLEPLRAPGAAPAVQRLFEELADELEAFV